MFWQKKEEATTVERLCRIENRLKILEAEMVSLYAAEEVMRNKILRKIQQKRGENEQNTPENEQNLYNSVLIPTK